jgi:hypothetical protein
MLYEEPKLFDFKMDHHLRECIDVGVFGCRSRAEIDVAGSYRPRKARESRVESDFVPGCGGRAKTPDGPIQLLPIYHERIQLTAYYRSAAD